MTVRSEPSDKARARRQFRRKRPQRESGHKDAPPKAEGPKHPHPFGRRWTPAEFEALIGLVMEGKGDYTDPTGRRHVVRTEKELARAVDRTEGAVRTMRQKCKFGIVETGPGHRPSGDSLRNPDL